MSELDYEQEYKFLKNRIEDIFELFWDEDDYDCPTLANKLYLLESKLGGWEMALNDWHKMAEVLMSTYNISDKEWIKLWEVSNV